MSWASATFWQIQCDGSRGMRGDVRCEERWTFEDEDGDVQTATFDEQTLCRHRLAEAREDGWMLQADGRALCPAHVAAQETMLAAQIDGLPFDETAQT